MSINPNFLSEIEAEKKTVSFYTIVRIANALDCSLDELAGKEISDATSVPDVDKAIQYYKEDSLVRKSAIMMALLDESEKFKVFTYIQD
ncbi:hypothetical protein AGMMS50276_03230 [Synergistales bacterium]|nr:hypothetical protein AGMMS50276_03230 [Synergistales bacterium]